MREREVMRMSERRVSYEIMNEAKGTEGMDL